jgi:hypothetical protein
MGTSFVTISKGSTGNEPGFWMRDAMLELWLRLLSLHLPEPTDAGKNAASIEIRNRWLLASRVLGRRGARAEHRRQQQREHDGVQQRREHAEAGKDQRYLGGR